MKQRITQLPHAAFRKMMFSHLLYLTFLATSVFGQNAKTAGANDPLKKPEVWAKIKNDYKNINLWEEYFGMKWDKMTKTQRKTIQEWQLDIEIELIESGGDFIGGLKNLEAVVVSAAQSESIEEVNEENFWAMPQAFVAANGRYEAEKLEKEHKESLDFIRGIDNMVETMPEEIVELFTNVSANLLLIEDWFSDEYAGLGKKYIYYDVVHPDGKYDKAKWVQEQRRNILDMKKKQMDAFKLGTAKRP